MLANVAAWSAQVLVLVVAVALVLRAFKVTEPLVRLRAWHGVLLVSFLLPLLQPWHVSFTAPPDAIALVGASNDLRQFDREVTATVSWWSEISWSRLALFVLIGGMGLRGALLLLGAVRLRQLRRASLPWVPEPAWFGPAQDTARAFASLRLSGDVESAVAFGWRRASIVTPVRLASASDAHQRAVIAHELQHVARRDWLVVIAEECARAVAWFHPAVWFALSEAQLAREEAVDRCV
ncbi:MAG: M56 family metallopeptidase, partial [Acidobacteria bacterium]|nr:M56 family metallopeptidase [Acidobacteriota bacterium]